MPGSDGRHRWAGAFRRRFSGGIGTPLTGVNPAYETSSEVVTGAYGGARARITPTKINPIFTHIPKNGGGITGGITARIADRPNSAPMLSSADFHSNIPGIGVLRNGLPTISFKRGTEAVHPAAVSDAVHVKDYVGVHPTTRRKVLRGHESL